MPGIGEHKNELIWDSAAPGWAKWESALMGTAAPATEQMLDAANVKAGMRVLDLACGAGSQTIQAARRVGPSGQVFANDIASKMLSFVAANTANAGLTNVETLHGPAEDLAGSGLRVGAAICRLGLMLFQSPQEALAGVRAVLEENGRLAVLVVASPQENPIFSHTMMIALKHAGKTPPPPGSPGLFALSDPAQLEHLFRKAGYTDTRVEQVVTRLSIPSVDDALTMMQEAFGAYRAVLADLDEKERNAAWNEVRDCLEQFSGPSGVSGDMKLLLASGTNPPT
jgi:ubiquinone/menaquinone biosynthesis C-methylase UbiE